jgi:hypothetical protein
MPKAALRGQVAVRVGEFNGPFVHPRNRSGCPGLSTGLTGVGKKDEVNPGFDWNNTVNPR